MTRTISILWVQIWTILEKTTGTGSSQPSETELRSMSHISILSVTMWWHFSNRAVTVLQQSMKQNVMNHIPLPIFVEMCDPHLLSYIF
jgi:hypothetical protein